MSEPDRTDGAATADIWDAVVIGAGPAGAVSSFLLARAGVRTLLADAKPLGRLEGVWWLPEPPCHCRPQVGRPGFCGLDACQPVAIHQLAIFHARSSVEVPLPAGVSVTRPTLDAALVQAAVGAGVTFAPETRCRVLTTVDQQCRHVRLTSPDGRVSIARARVVLACDGLGHPSLHDLGELASTVAPRSRIGLGCVVDDPEMRDCVPAGSICMAVAEHGYVGLARAEAGRLSIAAAVDPRTLAAVDSPTHLVRQILAAAGFDAPVIASETTFRGTPPITQFSSQVAAERLLLVGDAAGYVEPFTGEGMAAAIEGAVAVAPLARQAAREWEPGLADRWQAAYSKHIRGRQTACRTIAWLVRRPRLLRWSLASVAHQPRVAGRIARWVGSANANHGNHLP